MMVRFGEAGKEFENTYMVALYFPCIFFREGVFVVAMVPVLHLGTSLTHFTARKRSLRRLCFHRCLSVHGGSSVSVQGVSIGGRGWSPSRGCLSRGPLPWESLSRGVSVQGGLCQGDAKYGNERAVRILLERILVLCRLLFCSKGYRIWIKPRLITGRNEVVAKVMFLHVCVILFTGGLRAGRTPQEPGRTPRTSQTPSPRPGRHLPLGPGRHPPWDQADTPRPGRHPPPPDQADTTPGPDRPPRPGRHPPARKKTAAYGQ